MTITTETLTVAQTASKAVEALRVADKTRQASILTSANEVAEAIVEDGGITKNLGEFTLAMHGFDYESWWGETTYAEQVRTLYKSISERFKEQNASRRPVASFSDGWNGVLPDMVGFIPPVEFKGNAAEYRVERAQLTDAHFSRHTGYRGRIVLPVVDLHHFRFDQDDNETKREPLATIELVRTERRADEHVGFSGTGIVENVVGNYALGLSEIYSRRDLGQFYKQDKIFLARVALIIEHFDAYSGLTTEAIREAVAQIGAPLPA